MANLRLTLDTDERQFFPGDELNGDYEIRDIADLRRAEFHILWRTEGKGDEDCGFLLSEERLAPRGETLAVPIRGSYRVTLPIAPLSYDGRIVKIVWEIRLEAAWGKKDHAEEVIAFRLGEISPAPPAELDK